MEAYIVRSVEHTCVLEKEEEQEEAASLANKVSKGKHDIENKVPKFQREQKED